jgi:hypothetical protein
MGAQAALALSGHTLIRLGQAFPHQLEIPTGQFPVTAPLQAGAAQTAAPLMAACAFHPGHRWFGLHPQVLTGPAEPPIRGHFLRFIAADGITEPE